MRKYELKENIPVRSTPVESSLQTVSPLTKIEREMLTTLGEMERWFEDALHKPFLGFHRLPLASLLGERRAGDFVPSVDMFEEGNELVIKAELAGIKKEDIKVEISGNTLTLSGEKRGEEKVQKKDYYRVEQSYGSFCRSLELPEGVKGDEVKASYKDGLLEIRVPRIAEARKSHTVPIGG
ncbi:MAG TPA: Hsp20/alpha crystallin family protein [Geobacteraceae bacterium]|nr:Hsp20/alpha crystallin family protein [Geobacteraceae bacterium]